ncbi:nucleoside-diphosphate kinase [Arcanobacterium haemolyticum]|uniref:Nucleoside diphosphate kinase n=1 Tax=Arcanobacterium haemolyticum (strain ATCC 9345 / DSM 20595 / CCM 5947 / CCUG 17215 / LMG 16163 / NBRC 15585 / NCTC 8452 / 11018) TaxID=644284 RepID=D7BMZ7_ARCHD|nr:nucleoside-diphosphate kinase [Arcanobacterium haemolyticum]ADH92296.1 Nucleoside-diphosphate kinase [Arcanobacterium haemolyticum DSM 20595]QCX46432.1 nucleoside-diphosphate kinase [Arcanobacterium haemolyticum]SQH28983.1 Nucleoside diphosphate kinase [Arcanobacterium haemolyticum]
MTMKQQTLILVKPDGVRRHLTGQILARIEAKGYTIESMRMLTASEEQLAAHYHEHVDKPFYPGIVRYMTSGPIVAAVISGYRVIEGVRSLSGATDPTVAAPGTIRGDFGCDTGSDAIENLIHSSDSPESAEHEIHVWF